MSAPGTNHLPVLAAEIKAAHEACRRSTAEVVKHAIKAGCRLIEAKRLVPHGEWADWLRANVPSISVRTAQRYMRAAERAGKNDTVSFSSLRELIAPRPRPAESLEAATAAIKDNRRALQAIIDGCGEVIESATGLQPALEALRLIYAVQLVTQHATAAWDKGHLYRLRRFADLADFKQQAVAYTHTAIEWTERLAGPMAPLGNIEDLKADPASWLAQHVIVAWLVGVTIEDMATRPPLAEASP